MLKFFPEIRLIARILDCVDLKCVDLYILAPSWLFIPDKDWLKHKSVYVKC